MFSSKKEAAPVAPTPAAPAAAPANRAPRPSNPSVISADLVINGTLLSTGDIQVDGRVEGDVRSTSLVVGEKAFIHGELCAEEVTVRGRVQGSIRARKVLLCATSHVEGNILHEAFAVEAGAFFEGNCRHSDNPLAENPMDSQTQSRRMAPPAPMPSMPQPAAQPIRANGTDPVVPRPVVAVSAQPAASFTPLKA